VRRWEKSQGLPVHRHPHSKQSSVYAYRAELDAWWNNGHERLAAITAEEAPVETPVPSRMWRWALSIAAVLIVGGVAWFATQPLRTAPPPVGVSNGAIAVLPLRNVSGKPELNYLSMAAAGTIASRLSYGSVRVMPPEEIPREFLTRPVDYAAAAARLRVSMLVSGTYEEIPGRLRIHLQLMQMPGPIVVWQKNVDTNQQGIPSLGDLVAEQALPILGWKKPLPDEQDTEAGASELYLKGFDGLARSELPAAIENLEAALRESPESGPVQAHLALAYLGSAYSIASNPEQEEKGILLLRSAMAKNAAPPKVLSTAGLFLMEVGRLDEATEVLRRAVAINPRHAEPHIWLSQAYRYGGALEESLREAEVALRLDPEMRERTTINAYLYAGRYEEFMRGMPQSGVSARMVFYRGMAHLYQGELEKAESEFAVAARVEPGQLHGRYGEVFRLGIRGEREEGLKRLRQLESELHVDGEMRYKMAQAAAVLQDAPAALRLLRQAVEADFYCHSCFARDPLLKNLQGDAEFAALLEIARKREDAFRRKFFP